MDKTSPAILYPIVWRNMLRTFLGWPDARIEEWIEGWRSFLERSPMAEHEPASWYIVRLLIPPEMEESLSAIEQRQVKLKLLRAIDADKFDSVEEVMNCTWLDAHKRVQAVLSEFDGTDSVR